MRNRLSELSASTIEKIVQLEARSMLPVLASVGIQLTVDDIRKAIQSDESQTVLLCEHAGHLSAVVRYKLEANHIFISSIQLADSAKSLKSLRQILIASLEALQEETLPKIESVAQTANHSSIALHERLGFRRLKENPKAIRFELDRSELIETLRRLLRR